MKKKKPAKKAHSALLLDIDEDPEEIPAPHLPGGCVVCGKTRLNVGRFCSRECRDKWIAKAKYECMRYNGRVEQE